MVGVAGPPSDDAVEVAGPPSDDVVGVMDGVADGVLLPWSVVVVSEEGSRRRFMVGVAGPFDDAVEVARPPSDVVRVVDGVVDGALLPWSVIVAVGVDVDTCVCCAEMLDRSADASCGEMVVVWT